MSPPVRGVFFDLGGTLFSYRSIARNQSPLIVEAAKRLGVEGDARELGRTYRKASREANGRLAPLPYYLHRDLFHDTFRTFAAYLDREVSDDLLAWFEIAQRESMLASMEPREDCRDTLQGLRDRGLYTSIVSNIDDDYLEPLVDKWDLDEVLDHWTSSEEARSCKPDRAFFELALSKSGFTAGEVLFVGDSPAHDIQGANAAGMRSVLIVEEGTKPPLQTGPVDAEPHHEIRALSELLELVA